MPLPGELKPPEEADTPKGVLSERLRDVRQHIDEFSEDRVEKSHRDLLIASSIGFVISVTGAVPTKIEALGVEFSSIEQRWIFISISLVVTYFLLKFLITWQDHEYKLNHLMAEELHLGNLLGFNIQELQRMQSHVFNKIYRYKWHVLRWYITKSFDYWLPIIIGLISIAVSGYAAVTGHSVLQQVSSLPPGYPYLRPFPDWCCK
jgi:hypothetical protein